MIFKKFKGQIFDVELNKKEQKILHEEINKQIIESHQKFTDDYDYMVLRIYHKYFGHGLKRLRKAYMLLLQDNEALIKHYESADAGAYIARKEMNAIGVDIEAWRNERSE